MKRQLALILLVCLSGCLAAQDSTFTSFIELKPTKKILHISQMEVPTNTCVKDILEMMPELLNTASDFLWQNYAIQFDGKDVSDSRDVILIQTRVTQVKDIEISNSPSSSERNKGQGGVINIVPLTPDSGFHGRAILDVSTLWDVMPSTQLTFKKGDWWLFSGLMMEYCNSRSVSQVQQLSPTSYGTHIDSVHGIFGQETGYLMLKCKNAHHDFKFNFRETFSARGQDIHMPTLTETQRSTNLYERQTGTDQRDGMGRKLDMFVNLDYKYIFDNKNEIRTEWEYRHNPTADSSYSYYDPSLYLALGSTTQRWTNEYSRPNLIFGKVETKLYAFNHAKTDMMFFKLGVDGTYSHADIYAMDAGLRSGVQMPLIYTELNQTNQYALANTFFQAEWAKDKWYLQVDVRHQFLRDIVQAREAEKMDTAKHNLSGKISLSCHITPQQHLRLLIDRSLMRPSAGQMYPIMRYNPIDNSYTKGNHHLRQASANSVNLAYLGDVTVGEHFFSTNVSTEYVYACDLIEKTRVFDSKLQTSYVSYVNSGISHILNANLNVIYHYKGFTLSVAGNVYDRITGAKDNVKHLFYYNIAVAPIFRFRHDWTLAGKMLYNSPIRQQDITSGECLYMQLSLSKQWKNWGFFAKLNDVFDYTNVDTQISGDKTTYTVYDLYPRHFAVGFDYTF